MSTIQLAIHVADLTKVFRVPVREGGLVASLRAEALTSRLTVETLVIAAVFAFVLLVITRAWWRFGPRHYAGASA